MKILTEHIHHKLECPDKLSNIRNIRVEQLGLFCCLCNSYLNTEETLFGKEIRIEILHKFNGIKVFPVFFDGKFQSQMTASLKGRWSTLHSFLF